MDIKNIFQGYSLNPFIISSALEGIVNVNNYNKCQKVMSFLTGSYCQQSNMADFR